MSADRDIPLIVPDMVRVLMTMMEDVEVDAIYGAARNLIQVYASAAPELTDEDCEDPPVASVIDERLKFELVALSKQGCRAPLKKLAFMLYMLADPSLPSSGFRLVMLAVYCRVAQSDFMLTEYRDLLEHKDDHEWWLEVVIDGLPSKIKRTFPLWGVEQLHGLDNAEKAVAWYRSELRSRLILG